LSAGVLFFDTLSCRPLRTSCWIVGNRVSVFPSCSYCQARGPATGSPATGVQFRVRKSAVSRLFHPSDLRISTLRRPPRSGVSRLAPGQRQPPGPRPAVSRPRESAVHTLSDLDCEGRESTRPAVRPPVSGPPWLTQGDPTSRRLLARRHPRGHGHECKRYHPCARRPNQPGRDESHPAMTVAACTAFLLLAYRFPGPREDVGAQLLSDTNALPPCRIPGRRAS
jgi:hypothetical protein